MDQRAAEANTGVPYVARPLTLPNYVTLLHSVLTINTPFLPDV